FSIKRPQYVDLDRVKVEYYHAAQNLNSFLRKQTACNIIFRTAIVKAHHIRFNEDLDIYIDWSFLLEYMKYVNKFIRILNFPFYFSGEVYDPFETLT
ncbi:CDP-glycerol:glycerophosphate glycerophosphotransferase, partial [Staphylococcus epidermidis]